MSTRAVILPHPADPFLFNYWMWFFDNVWGDEVDKLYIMVASPIEPQIMSYMHDRAKRNSKVVWNEKNNTMDHGETVNFLLDQVKEPYVMLIEDDGFIFKRNIVDDQFASLERGDFDIIGSARGSCSTEILTKALLKWGLSYEGEGDRGPNFWPCFFFTKTDILRGTTRQFCGRKWSTGEFIGGLGSNADEDCYGDTFVQTSLELRGSIPASRIAMIPQYHGSPEDIEHFGRRYNLFDGNCPWVHIGSLSSGTHGVLIDDEGRKLARRTVEPPPATGSILPSYCNSEGEKREWERRVQWWLTFWEKREKGHIEEFATEYRKAIDRVIHQYGLSQANIRKRQEIYATLGL